MCFSHTGLLVDGIIFILMSLTLLGFHFFVYQATESGELPIFNCSECPRHS